MNPGDKSIVKRKKFHLSPMTWGVVAQSLEPRAHV